MTEEGVPIIGVLNLLDTGAEILLDVVAARMLADNILGFALEALDRPGAFLAGSVLHGGGLNIANEHGELWLTYSTGGHDPILPALCDSDAR